MNELVVLGLGSNRSLSIEKKSVGSESDFGATLDSVQILKNAVMELKKIFEPNSVKFSSVYKSQAMYFENQQDFYNMVFSGLYSGSAQDLLKSVNEIEAKYGRNRENEFRNGPRTLDIDIELFGNQVINQSNLEIPHKKMKERQFVLLPLLEIFPQLAEPISGEFFCDIAKNLPDQNVRFFCSLSD